MNAHRASVNQQQNSKPWTSCGRGWLLALAVISVPLHAANPANGGPLYASNCRGCHGDDGRGNAAGTPDFSRGQGLMAPDPVIVRSLRAGGKHRPSYEGLLREQQLLDLVAYLRTLQR